MANSVDGKGRAFIARAAVAQHKGKDDLWMVIHNKVYKVQDYLDEHPGGEEVLLDRAGDDATTDFEDVGHTRDARKQLDQYEIGELPPGERASDSGAAEEGGGGGGVVMIAAAAVAVVAAAAGYYIFVASGEP